jgi:hypothetical protein
VKTILFLTMGTLIEYMKVSTWGYGSEGDLEWMKFWTELANIVCIDLQILNFICSLSFERGVQNFINSKKIICTVHLFHHSAFNSLKFKH